MSHFTRLDLGGSVLGAAIVASGQTTTMAEALRELIIGSRKAGLTVISHQHRLIEKAL